MATLRDAERARDETAEELRKLGAHAISVEEMTEALDAGANRAAQAPAFGAGESAAGAEVPGRGADAQAIRSGVSDRGAPEPEQAGAPEPEGGANGLGSGTRRRRRRRSFAVVAWFEGEPPRDLPHNLEIRAGTRTRVVPLRARRAERFRAE